jgi:hypothetical protein
MRTSILLLLCFVLVCAEAQHPVLFVKGEKLELLRKSALQSQTRFGKSFADAVRRMDAVLQRKADVPLPKDDAGGYTHIRHQENYQHLYEAGQLYILTGDKKYSAFCKNLFLQYAKLIPTLPNHPRAKSSSPGRLFHQALNDCNWMVYSIQAYDAIYDDCTKEERAIIEDKVFGVLCNFLTKDLESWFNLIHNHGVWACTAVGMTGLVTGDDTKVNMALKGTKLDGKSGFYAQMSQLYAPDGYYTEGPYYARYAMLPFYIFSWALDHARPALNIFRFRDQILLKAFTTTIQMSNTDGRFYPLNDAIKDKNYRTTELMIGSNIALYQYPEAAAYMAVAAAQSKVMLNEAGLMVSEALEKSTKQIPPVPYRSMDIIDGADGKQGGLAILRPVRKDQDAAAILKYTSHGLSHGHYDKLNLVVYDQGNEVLQDYGAARFINIEQKYGGRYLPENQSFAVQTIAHNTLVSDMRSQFDAKEAISEQYHGDKVYSAFTDKGNIISARSNDAYPGQQHQRTVLQFNLTESSSPMVLDVYTVTNQQQALYDLPFWYQGQFIYSNNKYQHYNELVPLGTRFGYQHIWKEAGATADKSTLSYTFLNNKTYYSLHMSTMSGDSIYWCRLGANDPNFNLRREPMVMLRRKAANTQFVTLLEPHGFFNGAEERSIGSSPNIEKLETVYTDQENIIIRLTAKEKQWHVCINTRNTAPDAAHTVVLGTNRFVWKGHFSIQ